MNNNLTINWMADESFANAHPDSWERVVQLENQLIDMIGHRDLGHRLIDPVQCLRELTRQICGQEFSAVLDLTGWLTPAMKEMFPDVPIESRFTLSRVRNISSPKLETTGYRVSMPREEIARVRARMDLDNVLIVDDMGFSGSTGVKTMEMWQIPPETATHAFLLANLGDLGPTIKGAIPLLEGMGSKVVSGRQLVTPSDDGWHLKDLYDHPSLEEAFSLSLMMQQVFMQYGIDSNQARELFSDPQIRTTVFQGYLTNEQIQEMVDGGRFILKNGGIINGDEAHARNPFLWASPYFQEHLDMGGLVERQNEVSSTLVQLKDLTSSSEGRQAATLRLQQEVRDVQTHRVVRGKEAQG